MPIVRIQRTTGWRWLDLRELWAYRELGYFLTWRDVKVRYKQTAIGIVWVVLQPLTMMVIFTLFFGRLAEVPSDGVPYPLFAYTALLPWQLFSRVLTDCSHSLVADQRLVTRVYFPRIMVPLASGLAAVVDFAIASGLLIGLFVLYRIAPGPAVLWLPLFFLLLILTALGAGFWFSALNAEYRDVGYTMPFLTQLWLFLTPVVYPTSLVPSAWQPLYALNPMVGVVDGFRWTLLGVGEGPSPGLLVSGVVAVLFFVGGIVWFRRQERTFVDAFGSGGR